MPQPKRPRLRHFVPGHHKDTYIYIYDICVCVSVLTSFSDHASVVTVMRFASYVRLFVPTVLVSFEDTDFPT